MSTDGKYNYVNFAVDASAASEYYSSVWMYGVQNSDGSFDEFDVYVNDMQIQTITPKSIGWQELSLSNDKTMPFREGINVISIASTSKEIPNVECIKLAHSRQLSKIDRSAYDNFLKSVKSGDIEKRSKTSIENSADATISYVHEYSNVPVEYTFQTVLSLNPGDHLEIITESGKDHAVDLFVIGSLSASMIGGEMDILSNVEPLSSAASIVIPKLDYGEVATEVRRGLNWHAPAFQYNTIGNLWKSRISADITMKGAYMVRLRGQRFQAGEARLMINDKDYGFVPFTENSREIPLPDLSKKYKFFTALCNSDPVLFIENLRGSRIIDWNDDGGSGNNALLTTNFTGQPRYVHVSSYNSLSPSSSCTIRVQDMGSVLTNSKEKSDALANNTTGIESIGEHKVGIEKNILRLYEDVKIFSEDTIDSVSIYDMNGVNLYTESNSCEKYGISLSDANIGHEGIYIIRVSYGDHTESFKILVIN